MTAPAGCCFGLPSQRLLSLLGDPALLPPEHRYHPLSWKHRGRQHFCALCARFWAPPFMCGCKLCAHFTDEKTKQSKGIQPRVPSSQIQAL